MFDTFSIFSGKLFHSYSERSGDWLIEDDEKLISGTRVVLSINANARTTTQQVFDKFTGEDFGFTKTHVPVFLARYGDENLVSRSQAKRLLTRFERFKEIILDFENVDPDWSGVCRRDIPCICIPKPECAFDTRQYKRAGAKDDCSREKRNLIFYNHFLMRG